MLDTQGSRAPEAPGCLVCMFPASLLQPRMQGPRPHPAAAAAKRGPGLTLVPGPFPSPSWGTRAGSRWDTETFELRGTNEGGAVDGGGTSLEGVPRQPQEAVLGRRGIGDR